MEKKQPHKNNKWASAWYKKEATYGINSSAFMWWVAQNYLDLRNIQQLSVMCWCDQESESTTTILLLLSLTLLQLLLLLIWWCWHWRRNTLKQNYYSDDDEYDDNDVYIVNNSLFFLDQCKSSMKILSLYLLQFRPNRSISLKLDLKCPDWSIIG